MKVCINGMGRIGRALFRLLCQEQDIVCAYVNETYASVEDIIYFLKYDSLYGKFSGELELEGGNSIKVSLPDRNFVVKVFNHNNPKDLCAAVQDVDFIIDASGDTGWVKGYKEGRLRVLYTCCLDEKDCEYVCGVNDDFIGKDEQFVLSGSICDAVAIAPVLNAVYSCASVENVLITTMHPALSYQKVIDNYPQTGINRSLGRQYIDSIIPKTTSVENVLIRLFGTEQIKCMSFRIPTESVCAADITVCVNGDLDMELLKNALNEVEGVSFVDDDLVSIDFKGDLSSAVVDLRWLEVVQGKVLKMLIWYDNEFGYSYHIIRLLRKWSDRVRIKERI